jgi:hypothetical protein
MKARLSCRKKPVLAIASAQKVAGFACKLLRPAKGSAYKRSNEGARVN